MEAAWLLLANIHLGAGKLALAHDLCDATLAHNASSDRALTLRGACAEASGDFQVCAPLLRAACMPKLHPFSSTTGTAGPQILQQLDILAACWCVLVVIQWSPEYRLQMEKFGISGFNFWGSRWNNSSSMILSGVQVAAESYERAWRLTGASNPALGYQLAWNLLKACRNVDAVDVALQVRHRATI